MPNPPRDESQSLYSQRFAECLGRIRDAEQALADVRGCLLDLRNGNTSSRMPPPKLKRESSSPHEDPVWPASPRRRSASRKHSAPREHVRQHKREDVRDHPREDVRDHPREDVRDHPREDLRDRLREDVRDHPREDLRDRPREDVRDHPREDLRDRPDRRKPASSYQRSGSRQRSPPRVSERSPPRVSAARWCSQSPEPERNGRRTRSRSKSDMQLSVRMPHNTPADSTGEVHQAEVLERPALSSGEPIWQAEIQVPQGGINHAGRTRVFTIRGPPRKSYEAAEQDAEKLTNASVQGPKAVRTLANQMHRP